MKKSYILLSFIFFLFFSGCAVQAEKPKEHQTEITGNVLPTEAASKEEPEEIIQEALTMDKIKMLAEKEELCLQDLLYWENLRESYLSSSEKYYFYTLLAEDKAYRLDFSTRQDGQLGFVRLVDMQTMLSIDIRTGNIEHLLDNSVEMEDYLTFTFPETILTGDYDPYAGGNFGGCSLTLIDEKDSVTCGGIYILNGDRVKPRIVSGEMLEVADYDNHMYHSEQESLSIEQCPALLTLMSVEEENGETVQYYSVYFAKESDFYCYNLRLRADLLTKEEVMEIAATVCMSG